MIRGIDNLLSASLITTPYNKRYYSLLDHIIVKHFSVRWFVIRTQDLAGGYTVGETPVPIPNTEVKPYEVDGTLVARLWESRKSPVYFLAPFQKWNGAFYC